VLRLKRTKNGWYGNKGEGEVSRSGGKRRGKKQKWSFLMLPSKCMKSKTTKIEVGGKRQDGKFS
jgi:hypothetical protein